MTPELARSSHERSPQLARLLSGARFEVIPTTDVTEKVRGALPVDTTVTVTCSPQHGINRSLDVAERLSFAGFAVVPHLAARLVSSRGHLGQILERLASADVHEVFVVGGDVTPATFSMPWHRFLTPSIVSVWAVIRRAILW
jgi:methylenetetrahydrofolate reductase (NADPH)